MILRRYLRKIKYYKWRKRNIFVSDLATVDGCIFNGEYNEIKAGVVLHNCTVGKGTYIREESAFYNTEIGKFCSIGPRVKLICGEHPTSKYVSTHPVFYSGKKIAGLPYINKTDFKEYRVNDNGRYCTIGNDVWIGADVRVLGGVEIGNGAIVAAGAIVTKNVPPYAIVAGVPAKVVRYRFSEQQIMKLEDLRWWDKTDEWIAANLEKFYDVDLL